MKVTHDPAPPPFETLVGAFPLDLVIRTTPEPLLSGFLPFQSQYAQLLFLTTPLNDLDARYIDQLIADYRRLPQLRGR